MGQKLQGKQVVWLPVYIQGHQKLIHQKGKYVSYIALN